MEKYNLDNLDEKIKEKAVDYLNFIETFDRSVENVGIKDEKGIFGVKTLDGDNVIQVKLRFFTRQEKFEIQKLLNDNKTEEADLKITLYGIADWNLANEKGEKLPITIQTLNKMNDFLYKILNTLARAKNREPDAEEYQNFLII